MDNKHITEWKIWMCHSKLNNFVIFVFFLKLQVFFVFFVFKIFGSAAYFFLNIYIYIQTYTIPNTFETIKTIIPHHTSKMYHSNKEKYLIIFLKNKTHINTYIFHCKHIWNNRNYHSTTYKQNISFQQRKIFDYFFSIYTYIHTYIFHSKHIWNNKNYHSTTYNQNISFQTKYYF